MSLNRFVYYCAVIAGWAALLTWGLAEATFLGRGLFNATAESTLVGVLLGLAIGGALHLVASSGSGRWRPRISPRLALAIFVAACGGLIGAVSFSELVGLPRFVGWTILGLGVGAAEGIYENSPRKIRNGLIGGGIGGLLGGLLFDRIAVYESDVSSRAATFVLLGLSVGGLVGLAHVVLKEAWLTVADGFGPGRQLILSQTVTVLGRGDHLPLPFLGYAGRDLEGEHLQITRRPDGQYVVSDKGSRIGTMLNGQPVHQAVVLSDGDLIKLGSNIVRFNQRKRAAVRSDVEDGGARPGPSGGISTPPPPPKPSTPPPLLGDSAPRGDPDSPAAPPPEPPGRPHEGDPGPRIPPPPPPPG
jgi:hypothetical protein